MHGAHRSPDSSPAAAPPAGAFSPRERSEIARALEELAARGSVAGLELRRDRCFSFQGREHPGVLGVFLNGTRTAVFYDVAFAGPSARPERAQPLAPAETVRAVLGAALLGAPELCRQWRRLLRQPEAEAPAAVVLETGALTELLLGAETGRGLPLQDLGPEAAFALGYSFSLSRPSWLRAHRPDLAQFFRALAPPSWWFARGVGACFDPSGAPIRC